MLLQAVPVVTIAFLALVLPGIIWAWWCYPTPDGVTRLSVGLAIGLALQMFLLILLGIGPGITRESIALSTGVFLLIAALLAWRFHLPKRRYIYHWHKADILLVLTLVMILIPRLVPLAIETVPPGWDPSFHSLLASTTIATGHLPTWTPFEPIALHYPYGSHILIAAMSLLAGAAPDQVFAAFLNVFVPLLTCLALYALTQRALRRPEIALAAVIAYGLLSNWGSLQYAQWGGLPNALGFSLLLVFLIVFFAPGFTLYRVLVGGILLGAIPLAHNHVMLTVVLMLAVYTVFLIVRSFGVSRHGSEAGRVGQFLARRNFWRLVLTVVIALFASGFYTVPLLLQAGQYRYTNVLRLVETVNGPPFAENGWILWGLAVLGGVLLYVPLFGYLRVRLAGRGGAHLTRAFIAIALLTLALAFSLGYYAYRTYELHVHHEPSTAFTPSRFLTDMTYFLAIYAGIGLMALWNLGATTTSKLLKSSSPTRQRFLLLGKATVRVVIVYAVLLSTIVLISPQLFGVNGQLLGTLAPGEQAAFSWIQAHTAQNALIINLDPNAQWAPYFTRREVAITPIPTDEFTGGYVDEKRLLVTLLLQTLQHPGLPVVVVPNQYSSSTLAALVGRPLYILTTHAIGGSHVELVDEEGPEYIYAVPGGFSLLESVQEGLSSGVVMKPQARGYPR